MEYKNSVKNLINNFRKAREEGQAMVEDERIDYADYCEIMRGFEHDLRAAGVKL